jgi:peptidoglycan/LPS O-acetylase OafA/YrhL
VNGRGGVYRGHDDRVFGLDVLRASAVLFIVYGHAYSFVGNGVPQSVYMLPVFDGVTLFFVLSGFLIGRILLRTVFNDDFDLGMLVNFWVRRWFRTLPNYFLVLTLVVIATYVWNAPRPDSLASYFFFSQNLASAHPNFFPEAWSLAVEEWFYLCIPIPLYLSTRIPGVDRRRLVLWWIILVIVAVTAFRIYRAQEFGYSTVSAWDLALRKQVVTRLDSLMFGVLGAYISLYHERLWRNAARSAFIAGVSILLVDRLYSLGGMFYLNYIQLTASAVGASLLLPMLASWKRERGWLVKVITFVSLTSYSMYLLNFTPIQGVVVPLLAGWLSPLCSSCARPGLQQYAMYWTVTLAGSFLLYRHFEKPMTALRDKWRAAGGTVAPAFSGSRG